MYYFCFIIHFCLSAAVFFISFHVGNTLFCNVLGTIYCDACVGRGTFSSKWLSQCLGFTLLLNSKELTCHFVLNFT